VVSARPPAFAAAAQHQAAAAGRHLNRSVLRSPPAELHGRNVIRTRDRTGNEDGPLPHTSPQQGAAMRLLLWLRRMTAFVRDHRSGRGRPDAASLAMLANMETTRLRLSGLRGHACAATVAHALGAVPGVVSAHVRIAGDEAVVTYDPSRTTSEELCAAVCTAGYDVLRDLRSAEPCITVTVSGRGV
jgi:copper chaperone CopZ